MAMINIEESIKEINLAIENILHGGQEYTIGNRTIKKADLAKLFSEKARLERLKQTSHGVNLYYVY